MSERIVIGKETFFIESPERFAWVLKEKLGHDAADYFRGCIEKLIFDPENCSGECDKTYELQAHYERVIRDALEALEASKQRKMGSSWTSGKVDVEKFDAALKTLRAEL